MRTRALLLLIAAFSSPVFSQTVYPLNQRFEKSLPNEPQLVDQVRDGILSLQEKERIAHGTALRGTHAKGTCLGGEVEIYDVEKSSPAVASRLKKGMFSEAGKYSAEVRFANAKGDINPDSDRDVRAVSVSMHVPEALSNPQGLMDFTFNDATTFPINDGQAFADLMNSLKNGFGKTALEIGGNDPWGAAGREYEVGSGIIDGKVFQEHAGTTAYQQLKYWSTVPFALGANEAVKYKLNPCKNNPADQLKSSDPDEMRNELIRHVNNDVVMSCFDLQVQLLEPNRMTRSFGLIYWKEDASWWVENAATEWDEEQAPFYTVGRLTLTAKSIVDDKTCRSRWVNVTINNNETHHGLGSINRVRGMAESASFKARSK
jgi:catalase